MDRTTDQLRIPDASAGSGDASQDRGTSLELVQGPDGVALKAADGTLVHAAVELLSRPRLGKDMLLRAVGGLHPTGAASGELVDATAGLGADSFHLAASGRQVTMVERVPEVAELLRAALERAGSGLLGELAQAAAANLQLFGADARQLLLERAATGCAPAVVLIDPMYPVRGKSALPGKGMALFRSVVGRDEDAADLLDTALRCATWRVVVKRPLKAPYLGAVKPSGSLSGSTTRYDLYPPRPR